MFLRLLCMACFTFFSLSNAAEWRDMTDGTTTHATGATFSLVDQHVYRPDNAAAWTGVEVTLPDKANVTVRQATVSGFLGNTYTKLIVAATGELTFYGASGVFEVISELEKLAVGKLTLNDQTAGGLRIAAWTPGSGVKLADIVINAFGIGTTLDLATAFEPTLVGASPITLHLDALASIHLATLDHIPKLTGTGKIIVEDITTIESAHIVRLGGFKGTLVTRSGGDTSIIMTTAEPTVWTLSGTSSVKWANLKLLKGTVVLPADTAITFN